jgi:hypothetical protein
LVYEIKVRKGDWIGHIWLTNCLLEPVIEGKIHGRIEVRERRERRCKQLLDELKKTRGYRNLTEEALARTFCRTSLERR